LGSYLTLSVGEGMKAKTASFYCFYLLLREDVPAK